MPTNLPANVSVSYANRCLSTAEFLANASGWTPSEHQHLLRLIKRHARDVRRLRKISEAFGEGCSVRRERNRAFASFAGRACAELFQISQALRKGRKQPPLSWQEFEKNVRNSPLSTGKTGLAIRFAVTKPNGKKRIITNPGPRARAGSYHIGHVLAASGWSNPHDFNARGGSRDKALLAVREAILKQQVNHFVVFDIENNYPSVKPQHLAELRLPSKVTNAVFLQHASPVIWMGIKAKSAPQGLPQGAPASSQIASALLGQALRHIGGQLATVTYSDDGVIGASGEDEAEKVAKALTDRLANLPGGPIRLKYAKVCDARVGFEFLGYWIRTLELEDDLRVVFAPSHSAIMKFRRNLLIRLWKAGPGLTWDSGMAILEEYRPRWMGAFSLWQPTENELENFLGRTECWISDFLSLKIWK